MSADNGIYILQTLDGYRVVHAQAIENIYWEPDESGFNLQAIADYFGPCNVVKTEQDALTDAKILYDEIMDDDFCPIIEYGVQFIKGMENREFPVDLIETKNIEEDLEDFECPICSKPSFYGVCYGCGYKKGKNL